MAIVNYAESWIDTYNKYLGSINFTEGDFDGLKAVIRDYVTRQNPEGINDWQESSEIGMFVNAVAYLGENINYRVDLNVNDLFPSTTERKQSLLNFTRMLSYDSKRNICATGLAKLVSISTTEDITDTSGTILKGVTIKWNDSSNEDWMEQFLTILNSALVYTNQFGNPTKSVTINNISNQLYQFNNSINNSCSYSFSTKINNNSYQFEVVNPNIDIDSTSIEELTPIPERAFNILYRNDGSGNSSPNTGFFVYWKQGTLQSEIYNFDEKIQNNSISIDEENVNETDVWFEEIDSSSGFVNQVWTKIPSSEQLSYTKTNNEIRTIYKVETEENDKIKVKFSDGYFGDIPYGLYRLWYRISSGNDGLYIKPSDINNISIQIPYYNNTNSNEENIYYLTLTFSVVDVSHIRQAVPSESLESIRENASAIYSTQNRMVTGKDYNYFPRSIGQQLKVLKSVERTYSGNSRYVDINDPTGTYNPVDVIGTDGYLYTDTQVVNSSVSLNTLSGEKIYTKYIEPKFSLRELANVYYENYEGTFIPAEELYDPIKTNYYYWIPEKMELGQNNMVGVFIKDKKTITDEKIINTLIIDGEDRPNIYSTKYEYEILNDINIGDMLCFQECTLDNETTGGIKIFDDTNNIIWAKVLDKSESLKEEDVIKILEIIEEDDYGIKQFKDDRDIVWIKTSDTSTKNLKVDDDIVITNIKSRNEFQDDYGNTWSKTTKEKYILSNGDEITISEILDTNKFWKIRKGAYDSKEYSKLINYTTNVDEDVRNEIIERLSGEQSNPFSITYSTANNGEWIILDENVDISKDDLESNDVKIIKYDNNDVVNWFIRISYTENCLNIDSHESKIIFGSENEASFFFNTSKKDASNDGYFITNDVVKILKNQDNGIKYDRDYYWKPYSVIKYADGYVDTQEFACVASDGDKDAVIDVPTQINDLMTNKEEIIFVKSNSTSEKEYINFNNLNKIYKEYLEKYSSSKLASFESSMWGKTAISGYYYSYHKINQIIPAYGTPKKKTEHLYTPIYTVSLSNGTIINWNGDDIIDNINFGIDNNYDFVDYIKIGGETEHYYEEYDDDGNPIDADKIKHGFLYYYDATTKTLELMDEGKNYIIVDGIKDITFLWKHYPTSEYIIDPCSTNIIDMFVLTNTYYEEVQEWIKNGKSGAFPKAPSAYELKGIFQSLENNKMISDTMVWHPITYKLVFGANADTDTHCIFKVIKSDDTISDNEVKKNVIQCIDRYFQSMEVGETFYFTQLSTYIQNMLYDIIKTIVIVPTDTPNKFGNLFQIKCSENEIILSTATLNDVEIISTITDANIKVSS